MKKIRLLFIIIIEMIVLPAVLKADSICKYGSTSSNIEVVITISDDCKTLTPRLNFKTSMAGAAISSDFKLNIGDFTRVRTSDEATEIYCPDRIRQKSVSSSRSTTYVYASAKESSSEYPNIIEKIEENISAACSGPKILRICPVEGGMTITVYEDGTLVGSGSTSEIQISDPDNILMNKCADSYYVNAASYGTYSKVVISTKKIENLTTPTVVDPNASSGISQGESGGRGVSSQSESSGITPEYYYADYCTELSSVWTIAGYVIFAIKVFVPVILIIMSMIELVKAITAEKDIKPFDVIKNKVIAALAVFLVAQIFTILINVIGSDTSWEACAKCTAHPFNSNCALKQVNQVHDGAK